MSSEQYQRTVNSLDKEIADLEKKKAAKDKEVATLQGKINTLKKSINSHTSASTLNNKMRQIATHESDQAKKSQDSAELGKKIAEKRKKRAEAYLKLQKEQQNEQKKQDKANRQIQASYEARIKELQQQISQPVVTSASTPIAADEEYDVFVSHAYEDKESFVDEFVEALRNQGLKVWYDTNKLKWGDSMREKIDRGLAKSRYGVVILSPNYIAEHKYWTKAELNGLFQVETVNGKTILPIWHNLTKKQVVEYSPIIADRKAMTTASMTPEEIAAELKELRNSFKVTLITSPLLYHSIRKEQEKYANISCFLRLFFAFLLWELRKRIQFLVGQFAVHIAVSCILRLCFPDLKCGICVNRRSTANTHIIGFDPLPDEL